MLQQERQEEVKRGRERLGEAGRDGEGGSEWWEEAGRGGEGQGEMKRGRER